MAPPNTDTIDNVLLAQRALWRRQGASIPKLHGGKRSWFRLLLELVDQVGAGTANAMEARPNLPAEVFGQSLSRKAAAPRTEPLTWEQYSKFLKTVGLAQLVNGELKLTSVGKEIVHVRSAKALGVALTSRYGSAARSGDNRAA